MRIRNIDKNNDWLFGKGQTDYVRDAYAVVLDIKLKLQEWYMDCFFANQNGIDWKARLGQHNQKQLLDNDILRIAQGVEGVISIYGFNSYIDGRRYKCDFWVYQEYSPEGLPISFDSYEVLNG